ncbi:ABC transporter permease [Aliikangiella coralliicola]|uniref:Transport permease protein n=1 Tax=Aliikangiella coralliicola TaxID=2592383 RepID=A0A545UEM4_9GAMM|nr:ABC transporter permease [Aliikangiella coralliicola]TQV87908.1 ABC transporter permease [Aliikangiella coralliicola]
MNIVATESQPDLIKIYLLESKAEILKVIRSPGFTLPSLLFPVMFYLFFGVIFTMNAASMPTYLLATYGTFGVIGPALFSFGVGIAIERGQGWFELKEVSPMPASAYILGRVAVTFLFSVFTIILLFTIGAIFGEVRLQREQWLLLAVILTFGSIPFCAIGMALGLYLKSNSAPAVVNLLYLPMAFLSGLWVPINFFPELMQSVANFLPAYHLAQLGLKVVSMDSGQSVWLHIGILSLYLVVFSILALKAYTKKDKQ